jgi:hypothetical protein
VLGNGATSSATTPRRWIVADPFRNLLLMHFDGSDRRS